MWLGARPRALISTPAEAQTQKALPEVNRKLLEQIHQDVEELEKYGERQEPAEKSN